jgi:hypothetical protein
MTNAESINCFVIQFYLQICERLLAFIALKARPIGLVSFPSVQLSTNMVEFVFHNVDKALKRQDEIKRMTIKFTICF